jgi:peptide subunit release factor 1 (eRF1)
VKRLFRAYRTGRLGIFGVAATAAELQIGKVEELIISSDLRHEDREVLVRLASQHSIPIETVRNSRLLNEQGGVGAILRYSSLPFDSDDELIAA